MLNFRKIAAASKGALLLRYFTENTPEPIHPAPVDVLGRALEEGGRLTAYYTGRDSRATWRPDAPAIWAEAVGIDPRRMPRDAELTRLFEARRADDGAAWSEHRRKLSGFDLVFSPHKSVTLAAEFAPTAAESAAIWNAIDRANDRAMRHVAAVLGYARMGKGGADGAEPGAVGWVSFRHHTARPTLHVQDGPGGETYLLDAPVAGDPHAHVHNFLPNLVVTASGRVGSLDTQRLTDARVKEFGAYFQAEMADELRRLGVSVAYDAGEHAVVLTSVPEPVWRAFSKRDREVLAHAKAYAAAQGLDWDTLDAEAKMDLVEGASAAGRLGKTAVKSDERRIWREQAEELGWEHRGVLRETAHAGRGDRERIEEAAAYAARHLAVEFHTAAVVVIDKLAMHAARGLIGAGIPGGAADIERVVALLVERGIEVRGERVRLLVGQFREGVGVTHSAQVRIEEDLQARAWAAARDRSAALPAGLLGRALAASPVAFTPQQAAAVRALGEGAALTLLTGAAGVGKTTLLAPLVEAWKADTRFAPGGREVVGAAMAWRQADALKEAGAGRAMALAPLLKAVEAGEWEPTRNTVLVLDEASQIGPRPMLQLLELQARTGMTIKMLGDREQAQAIEAGDTVELLRRALPPEALPELLTTVRQATKRAREVAGLFREGGSAEALAMKREDGHALLVGGDRAQVVGRIADLYLQRRDLLAASGALRGAIRSRLKARGEVRGPEVVHRALDRRGQAFDLPVAEGDRVRLFARTWGRVDGKLTDVGSNGDVVTVIRQAPDAITVRAKDGRVAEVEWSRLADDRTGRLRLGFGHALTIDAAQGLTSDEHINALPRGTAGVTAFTAYVAESRARGTTWTVVSEGALREAERHRQALGDVTPITEATLWARAAEDMARKPYKALAVDLDGVDDKARAVDARIATGVVLETALARGPGSGRAAVMEAHGNALAARVGAARLSEMTAGLRAERAAAAATIGASVAPPVAKAPEAALRPRRPAPSPRP